MSLSLSSPSGAATRATSGRLGDLFWGGVVPAAGAFAILRYVFPSRLEGAVGGPIALAARFADEQPLVLMILLFILLSQAIHHWRRVLSPDVVARAEAAGSPRGAAGTLGIVASVALVALFVRFDLVQTYRVEGPSMLPTFQEGDRLLVDKTAYGLRLLPHARGADGHVPRRGDVVVLKTSQLGASDGEHLVVKRVLGLPGDRISFNQGMTFINGWQVPSCDAGPYASVVGARVVKGRLSVEFLEDKIYLAVLAPGEEAFPEFLVPDGQVFVAGDDRGLSNDSRRWNDRRGAGAELGSIEGRVSRIVLGGRRDGRLDLTQLFRRPGLGLREPALDTRIIEGRVAGCAKLAPKDTTPPPPPAR